MEELVTCREIPTWPTFTETFITCPSIAYTILSCLNVGLVLFQLLLFFHLLYIAYVERRKEVPYLASLAPICSIISVIELFNLSTVELLSAFRYVYLVFCILQFYQYIASYYGDWDDIVRLLPGFVYETQVCCACCKYNKELCITRRGLYANKALVYTGVITYMIMIMITVAFTVPAAAEDVLLTVGIVLFIVGIRAMKRFITITQQFYPELAISLRKKWTAVRLCFLVVGLQGFVIRLFEACHVIPPVDLFNSKVMVDVIHNMLVPTELCFAMVLSHRAFNGEEPTTVETTPLLPKQQRGNIGSQTDDLRDLTTETLVRCDSGVDSPELDYGPGYGSLNNEMMRHVDQAIEENWRRSHPDLYQAVGYCVTSRGAVPRHDNSPYLESHSYQGIKSRGAMPRPDNSPYLESHSYPMTIERDYSRSCNIKEDHCVRVL